MVSYKMSKTHKYNNLEEFYMVYQVKDSSDFKPYEPAEVEVLEPKFRDKFTRYSYAKYKGENQLG